MNAILADLLSMNCIAEAFRYRLEPVENAAAETDHSCPASAASPAAVSSLEYSETPENTVVLPSRKEDAA